MTVIIETADGDRITVDNLTVTSEKDQTMIDAIVRFVSPSVTANPSVEANLARLLLDMHPGARYVQPPAARSQTGPTAYGNARRKKS